jgi:hypothetical protein
MIRFISSLSAPGKAGEIGKVADETRSAVLEPRTAGGGVREAKVEAVRVRSAATPALARKARRKAGWAEFIVDVWITNFHWVKFGLYKHSRNRPSRASSPPTWTSSQR